MLKEKQSMAAQNSQLWRLVDKQRAMILGLNKDLERALKEKDRYRKKLKEHMGMIPPLPTSSAVGTGPSRTLSESPAPSLDETHSRSESNSPPPRRDGITRSESLASSIGGTRDELLSSMEIAIAPYPMTPSPTHPQQALSPSRERMPSPTEHNGTASADLDRLIKDANLSDEAPTFRDPRELASGIRRTHDDDGERVGSPTPLSPKTTSPASQLRDDTPRWYNSSEPMTHAKKLGMGLGLTTSLPPAVGMGKSPLRKAPPKPLDLPHSQLQNQVQQGDDGDDAPGTTTHATCDSDDSWQVTPEDKKGQSVNSPPRWVGNGPLTAPATRPPPAPYIQNLPLTPGPNNMVHRLSPEMETARIRAQWANRAPLPSPGLPSSPRPMDRPPNSPLPRASRNFSLDSGLGLPGTPKPVFQSLTIPATPRSSMPMPSPRMPSFGHERAGSEGSTPSQKSPTIELLVPTSTITSASVNCRVVSSRMKPSRASMIPGKTQAMTDSVFTLGLFSNADGREILRVEKDAGALPALDSRLRKYITYHVGIPDRELFIGHAPARVDARRVSLEEYFGAIFAANMNEPAALALCEFFSTDVVESCPTRALEPSKESPVSFEKGSDAAVVKEGYLTKRGKNFGGWKERYFALEGSTLKYFDGPGGAQLGQIKLHNAQIGRQSSKAKGDGSVDDDSQYRHAFLVLEPKRKDSSNLVRHVLCAENDKERDEWVSALLEHVTTDKEDEGKSKLKHSKSKDGKETKDGSDDGKNGDDSSLRSMSYDDASQGPAPARGPTPEELSRQQVSPSPNSMLSQPGVQFSAAAPVPERGHPAKQISAPTNGSVISDLAAWGASKISKEHEDKKAEKALKKRSIWGFKQKVVSDVDEQKGSHNSNGHQQAAERFPLARAVFGASLEEAVYLTKPPGVDIALPSVVYRCIEYLDAKNASDEEGIFRLSGSNLVIKRLKDKFNSGKHDFRFCWCSSGLIEWQNPTSTFSDTTRITMYMRSLAC
jgi:RalA-binding protein 1